MNNNRADRRYNSRLQKRIDRENRKHRKIKKISYFVLPNEVLEMYRTRKISTYQVKVFAYLSSLSFNGGDVRVSQSVIAKKCGICTNTVSDCVNALYSAGLITRIITPIREHSYYNKYETSIYTLKELPRDEKGAETAYFFVPRIVFSSHLIPKMFAIYLLMCMTQSFEYGKSWNSYKNIAERLGYNKCQRSELTKLIRELTEKFNLIKKLVRKVKKEGTNGVEYVKNIYRVADFESKVLGVKNIVLKKLVKCVEVKYDELYAELITLQQQEEEKRLAREELALFWAFWERNTA